MTETKPKFTPGPWRICNDGGTVNYRELVIRDRPPINSIKQLPADICCCTGCLNNACEREANAALIAAAPEMYELLDRIRGRLESCKLEQSIDVETEREIRQLLAKARGEEGK